jgi:putative SOS response-associated peptidase YedK
VCGRYQFTGEDPDERVAAILEILERTAPGVCSLGEILPGTTAPAVLAEGRRLRPVPAVFGFPGYDGKKLLLNARSETAAVKPSFAQALRERRLVLPADAFFEWGRADRQKYRFRGETLRTMYLCGLYTRLPEGLRFVILTRPAAGAMLGIHERMPLILGPEAVRPWLTREAEAREMLKGVPPRLAAEPAG